MHALRRTDQLVVAFNWYTYSQKARHEDSHHTDLFLWWQLQAPDDRDGEAENPKVGDHVHGTLRNPQRYILGDILGQHGLQLTLTSLWDREDSVSDERCRVEQDQECHGKVNTVFRLHVRTKYL